MLGKILLSLHNITQLVRFSSAMSQAIREGCFAEDFAPWEPGSAAAHTW
jgi:queuine tRNA-ribosyltransferase